MSQKSEQSAAVSPLVSEATYGEKKYHFIFDRLINFWANLFSAAAFTFWMVHFKGTVAGKQPPQIYADLKQWIHDLSFMEMAFRADPTKRMHRAAAMANALMLGLPGHLLVIPGVWLGNKFKSQLVRKWDRKHYGADADSDPTIAARHEIIDEERKPTLLGVVIARAGSIIATESAGFLIGSGDNFINSIGRRSGITALKKFPGIDPLATQLGDNIGDGLGNAFPGATSSTNGFFARNNFSWSADQLKENPILDYAEYNGAVKNFSRYVVTDILYTLVSAITIHPILNMVKYVPGLSYRQKPVAAKSPIRIESNIAPEALTASPAPERDPNKPSTRVSQASAERTLAEAAQREAEIR